MSATILRQLSDLAAVRNQIRTVDKPSLTKGSKHRQHNGSSGESSQYEPNQPRLPMRPEDAIEFLETAIDAAYAVQGMPSILEWAQAAVSAMTADANRHNANKEGWMPRKGAVRALDRIVREATTHSDKVTRPVTVSRLLSSLPAVDATGRMLKIKGDKLVEVTRPQDATNTLDVFLVTEPSGAFDPVKLKKVEEAKLRPEMAVRRNPELFQLRQAVPDAGSALLITALKSFGFRRDGWPEVELLNAFSLRNGQAKTPVLVWGEAVLLDLREVLGTQDLNLRGRLFSEFCTEGVAMTTAEFDHMVTELERARVQEGANEVDRKRAEKVRRENEAYFAELEGRYKAIQKDVDSIQEEAVRAVDSLLAVVRYKAEVKAFKREMSQQEKNREAGAVGGNVASLAAAREQKGKVRSSAGVEEALDASQVEAVDVVRPFTQFDADGIEAPALAVDIDTAGLGGAWEWKDVYPGVLWEVRTAPAFLISDINEEFSDDRIVVVAPRRVNGLGVDASASRAVTVVELLHYFTCVEE